MKLSELSELVFKTKTQKLTIQVFRYLIVSGVSLAVDTGILTALTELGGVNYLVSAVVGYLTGLVVNYFLSRIWVFHSSKLESKTAEFLIFAAIGLVGMGINELILWVWVSFLGLHYIYGRMVSAVIGYTWKYVARKWLLFR
jgi:putative flippase GtrA